MYPNPVSHVREWTQINEDYRSFPNQLHIQEERSTEVIKKSQKVSTMCYMYNNVQYAVYMYYKCVYNI